MFGDDPGTTVTIWTIIIVGLATFVESRGGMLQQSQLILFIAVKDQEVNPFIAAIRNHCRSEKFEDRSKPGEQTDEEKISIATQLGGGVIFM